MVERLASAALYRLLAWLSPGLFSAVIGAAREPLQAADLVIVD
jgi:hypothetical protein